MSEMTSSLIVGRSARSASGAGRAQVGQTKEKRKRKALRPTRTKKLGQTSEVASAFELLTPPPPPPPPPFANSANEISATTIATPPLSFTSSNPSEFVHSVKGPAKASLCLHLLVAVSYHAAIPQVLDLPVPLFPFPFPLIDMNE